MQTETRPSRSRWIKLGLESLAVLVSILTAFAIDASWDRHQAIQDEQATLERLLAEFEANRSELEAVGAGHARVHDAGIELLRIGHGMSEPSAESFRDLRMVLGMSIYFDPSMGALSRFLTTEQPGYIASPQLRDRLAGYPARVDELWQQERLLRDLIASQIEPFLIRSTDRLRLLPPATSSDALQELRVQVWDQDETVFLKSLLGDAEVRNLISVRVILEAQSYQKFERVENEFEEIAEALRRDVGGDGPS